MKSPFTGKDMTVVKEWRTLRFRKEVFEILFHAHLCQDTGEQFEDEHFSQLNYLQLINQYREKYVIPFPAQITSIREMYDLPASRMSEILGFGINSYRLYEAGEVPSQSNARLIQLAEDPREFGKLVFLCNSIDQKTKEKLNQKVKQIMDQQESDKFYRQLQDYLLNASAPNKYSGYTVPSIEKFSEMVVYLSSRMQPWKTKLNKLLFYADFLMYSKYVRSISGVQYMAMPMGPVPVHFNAIFDFLVSRGDIEINYFNFSGNITGEQFMPGSVRKFNSLLFSSQELDVLEFIAQKFSNTSTAEMIEASHEEKAWTENITEKKVIDYTYAFFLNL